MILVSIISALNFVDCKCHWPLAPGGFHSDARACGAIWTEYGGSKSSVAVDLETSFTLPGNIRLTGIKTWQWEHMPLNTFTGKIIDQWRDFCRYLTARGYTFEAIAHWYILTLYLPCIYWDSACVWIASWGTTECSNGGISENVSNVAIAITDKGAVVGSDSMRGRTRCVCVIYIWQRLVKERSLTIKSTISSYTLYRYINILHRDAGWT